jgi:putative sigma-54 modulation protein
MPMDHPIQITARNSLEITPAIRNAVLEKFEKLEHHFNNITHIHVFLSVAKVDRSKPKVNKRKLHTAKALLLLPDKHEIVVEETKDDLYTSIDVLVDVLDRQLINTGRVR